MKIRAVAGWKKVGWGFKKKKKNENYEKNHKNFYLGVIILLLLQKLSVVKFCLACIKCEDIGTVSLSFKDVKEEEVGRYMYTRWL